MESTAPLNQRLPQGLRKLARWMSPKKLSFRTRQSSSGKSDSVGAQPTIREFPEIKRGPQSQPPDTISFPSSATSISTLNETVEFQPRRHVSMSQDMATWDASIEEASRNAYDADMEQSVCRTLRSPGDAVSIESCLQRGTTCFVHLFNQEDQKMPAIDQQLQRIALERTSAQFVRIQRSSNLTGYLGYSPSGPSLVVALYSGEIVGRMAEFPSTDCSEVPAWIELMDQRIRAHWDCIDDDGCKVESIHR